jgi:predicted GNAT superfamily acetyltransferase
MTYKKVNTASRVIPVYLSIQNPAKLNTEQANKLKHADNYTKAQREVFNDLKSQGYDGVDFGHGVYVVFEPTQIKSAIGNNGNFDPKDPNIHK